MRRNHLVLRDSDETTSKFIDWMRLVARRIWVLVSWLLDRIVSSVRPRETSELSTFAAVTINLADLILAEKTSSRHRLRLEFDKRYSIPASE